MRYLMTAALCLAATLLVSACATASGIPKPAYNTAAEIQMASPYFKADVIDIYHAKTGPEQGQYRNAVVYNRMRACDVYYDIFIREVSASRATGSVAADSAVLLLSGAAGQIKPASTAAILSALSGGVVGLKGSVDKQFFYDSTLPALIAQMESGRSTVRANIKEGLSKGPKGYSLDEALLDVRSYCMAGSIPGALSNVTKQAGVAQTNAEDKIATITRGEEYLAGLAPIKSTQDRVDALGGAQVRVLAATLAAQLPNVPPSLRADVTAYCPSVAVAVADETKARRFLLCWAAQQDGSPAQLKIFTDGLDLVETN